MITETKLTKTDAAQPLRGPLSFPTTAVGDKATFDPNDPKWGGVNADRSDTELVILPEPVGHHMLIALPTMAEMTAGGIIIPHVTNERERAAAVVGKVLAMGKSCYKDTARFPDGAWCATGDTVMFTRYQGVRFKSKDPESGELVEYRMMADDQIIGTVPKGATVEGL